MLARAKKCSTKTKNVNTLAEKEESLSRDKIKVGDFLSNYQFFAILLLVYLLVMGGIQVVIVFKEVLFITIPLLVWFGLKIKSL